MNGYDLALLLHIAGILALFGGETLIVTALGGAQRAATVEGVREWTRMGMWLARITPVFAVLAFIPAAYMVSDRRGWQSHWVNVAMLSLLVLLALLVYPILPRLSGLARQANEAPAGAVASPLDRAILDPVLWLAAQLATTIYAGIVVLMVFKPDTGPALAVMGVALLLGLLSSAPALLRYRKLAARP